MIYFISYGNHNYKSSKDRIKQEAHNMGFDSVKIFGPENISEDFVRKTYPYISHPRGAGYWLWKSFFLKNTLDEMNENDFCIYADAGCHLNIHGKKRLVEYLKMISDDESGIISFEMPGLLEEMYTNEMVFEYFNIDKESPLRKTSQYVGGILIIKKCLNTSQIVDEYYKIAVERPDLFSDIHNNYKKTDVFRDHRHDQSILGILRKKYKSLVIRDETWAEDFRTLSHVPILATRIRN